MIAMEQLDPTYCINRACKRVLESNTPECPFCRTFQGETGPPPEIDEIPRYEYGGWLDGTGGQAVTWGWHLYGGAFSFTLLSLPFWGMLSHSDAATWLKADPILAACCLFLLWPAATFGGELLGLGALGLVSRKNTESPILPIIAVLGALVIGGLMCLPFLRTLAVTYVVLTMALSLRFGAAILERD